MSKSGEINKLRWFWVLFTIKYIILYSIHTNIFDITYSCDESQVSNVDTIWKMSELSNFKLSSHVQVF